MKFIQRLFRPKPDTEEEKIRIAQEKRNLERLWRSRGLSKSQAVKLVAKQFKGDK